MKWLKEEAGVEAIVILGNSGGGSLMGAYQAEAIAPTLTDRLPPVGQDALASIIKGDLPAARQAADRLVAAAEVERAAADVEVGRRVDLAGEAQDRKSTRLNSSHQCAYRKPH